MGSIQPLRSPEFPRAICFRFGSRLWTSRTSQQMRFARGASARSAGGDLSTMRLHLKDGRVIEATTRLTPDGGWVTAHEDVTDRVGYEQTLREQNILFDAALENMAHGLCVFDERLAYRRAQPALPGDVQSHAGGNAARHAGAGGDPLQHGARDACDGTDRGTVFWRVQAACGREQGRHHRPARCHQRPAARRAPSADGERRLGRHLRGHHRARARGRGAERAVPPLRCRAGEHGARAVHVRQGLARDRAQPALPRAVRPEAGGGAAGHPARRPDPLQPGEPRPRFRPTRPRRRCSRISSGGSRTGRTASRRWCAASPMAA